MGQDPFFYCDSTNTTLVKIYMNNVYLFSPLPCMDVLLMPCIRLI